MWGSLVCCGAKSHLPTGSLNCLGVTGSMWFDWFDRSIKVRRSASIRWRISSMWGSLVSCGAKSHLPTGSLNCLGVTGSMWFDWFDRSIKVRRSASIRWRISSMWGTLVSHLPTGSLNCLGVIFLLAVLAFYWSQDSYNVIGLIGALRWDTVQASGEESAPYEVL